MPSRSDGSRPKTYLTLGWQVTDGLEPRYWRGVRPKAGNQSDDDLVLIPSEALATHMAIIAQSGSGKSFFLGRLIEEILLNTRARCVVLDPNADFQKAYEVEDRKLWEKAKYDGGTGRGKLPHESSRRQFETQWSLVRDSIRIKTGGISRKTFQFQSKTAPNKYIEPLQLSWSSLSMDFLAEEVGPMQQSDLHHCHTFVQGLDLLFRLFRSLTKKKMDDLIGEAEQLFRQARLLEGEFRSNLEREFNAEELIKVLFKEELLEVLKGESPLYQIAELIEFMLPRVFSVSAFSKDILRKYIVPHFTTVLNAMQDVLRARVKLTIDGLCKAPKYINETVEHFYFSKAREYESAGILQTSVQKSLSEQQVFRLEVINLPSLEKKSTRMLAINAVLDREWDRARKEWGLALQMEPNRDRRSPTFIIVDEAHNLIPADPRGVAEAALSEQFRKIVAEGRKYGLFLILVSQRPDKLDPLVLSECENKAIMKLSSISVLEITRKMLGLDDVQPKLLEKCLDFKTGRVLLVGRWSPDRPQLLYSAARRTVEGGRNLREEYWASAIEPRQKTVRAVRVKRSKSKGKQRQGGVRSSATPKRKESKK
jgi:uncharacterized protein DUF87